MSSVLTSVIYNPSLTKTLGSIEAPGMFRTVVFDTSVNNAVAKADEKRDSYGGAEMKRNLWFTTVVWGFGVQACNAAFDKFASAVGRPLVNANVDVVTAPGFEDESTQWVEKALKSTDKAVQSLAHEVGGVLKNKGQAIAPQEAAKLLDQWGVGRFLLAGVLPAVIVGPVFSPINRHITKVLMAKDLAAKDGISYEVAKAKIDAAHAKDTNANDKGAMAKGFGLAGGVAAAGATGLAAFGKLTPALRALNSNEVLTNLLGVDSVITGGRIMSGDTKAEKQEWMIQEALLIGMVYFGAPWLNDAIKDGLGHLNPALAPYTGLKFETLEKLHKQFGNQPDALAQFQTKLVDSAKDLGLDISGTDSKQVAQHLLENSGQLLKGLKEKLAPGVYEPGKNVIVDLVVEAEAMPLFKESPLAALKERGLSGLFNPKVLGYNPTQSAHQATVLETIPKDWKNVFGEDTAGVLRKGGKIGNAETIEGLVHSAWQLGQEAGKAGAGSMEKVLTHTSLLKAGALGAALAVNYGVLGVLSPKLRHLSTAKMTGGHGVDWLKHPVTDKDTPHVQPTTTTKAMVGPASAALTAAPAMTPVTIPTMPVASHVNVITTAYVPPLPMAQRAVVAPMSNPFAVDVPNNMAVSA
jgi:hypothetical protein